MRLLCITQDFPPNHGGIANFLHNLSDQLCRLGHQVDVLTPTCARRADAGIQDSYRVLRYVSLPRLSSIIPIHYALTLHRRNNYDLILVGHFMTTHALGVLILCKLWGVPYVILSHGNDLIETVSTWVDKVVAHLLLRNATLMLGNSHFTAERIREAGYQGPIETLNPGVGLMRFHPGVDIAGVRQEYGLNDHRVLLTTARLVAKKNVDGVLHALPQVIKHVPDVIYLVAGDGEQREQLEALCDKLGLRPYVLFLGYVEPSKLSALYCVSDLVVMPTKGVESFGISFIEANACGKPVIAGRSGGTADAVIDGETGVLVDPYDVGAIATAIIRLLADKEMAYRLGGNGRLRVERELSWEKVGERLEKALLKVLERCHTRSFT